MEERLKFETWHIDRLIEYARNPRKNDHVVDKIAAAIKEFGFRVPVVAKSDGLVVDGHLRLKAAKKLGLSDIPVILADDMTDAQIKAFRISVNRMSEFAEWDNELLALELSDLKGLNFDLDLTGFSPDEIAALQPIQVNPGLTDEDEVPEPPKEPVTKPGDVWVIGDHRLLCGDSTSIADLERLCAGQRVDMWLTDPPYNVAYEGGTKEKLTIQNDSMGDNQFRQFLRDAYTAADAVMKAGAVFYIWHADSEGYNFRGAAKDAGWTVRQCLIWKKSSLVLGRQDYHWQHEPCLYGWKDGAGHLWAADRKQTTIMEFDKPSRNGEHPTMKPVALFEYQMLNNTKGGDMVLDSFGGSGTTLIAAEKNGRVARLMELDPIYCDVIVKRWQDFTGLKAIHAETGQPFTDAKNA
jgi:DNA modification methylase